MNQQQKTEYEQDQQELENQLAERIWQRLYNMLRNYPLYHSCKGSVVRAIKQELEQSRR